MCFVSPRRRSTTKLPTFPFTLFYHMQHMASQGGGSDPIPRPNSTGVGAQVAMAFFIFKPEFLSDLRLNFLHSAPPMAMFLLGFLSW